VPNLRTAVRYHRYPEAHQLLAYALNQLDKTAEAQAVIQSGLEVFPNDPGLMEMRKPDPKPANYSEGSPLRESTPLLAHIRTLRQTDERLFWLNKIYTERAAELFDRLEQIAPDSARDMQAKGLNAEYAEDYATAEAYYRQALLKAPQIVGLHFSLGHVLRMEGKDDEAEAELRRDFQNHLTYYERGLIRNKKGQYAEAVRLLQNAVQLQPSFTAAQTELAKAYLQTAQPAKAVPLLESVLTRQSNHPTAHFLLSRAFRNLNQPDLAERELDLHRKLLQQERSTARVRHEQKDPPR
jgi:tetratricopeptide (TPR) repeat protein